MNPPTTINADHRSLVRILNEEALDGHLWRIPLAGSEATQIWASALSARRRATAMALEFGTGAVAARS